MAITLTLKDEVEKRLKQEASRRGIEAEAFATKLIEDALPSRHPDQATLDWLAKWEKENSITDPEELAQAEKELEEFKQAMNRNRLETEGPNARTPFP